MTDSANDPVDTQLAAETYISPLRLMAIEAHEIFEELEAAGFTRDVSTQIIARVVSDSVLQHGAEYEVGIEIDDDDEDDEDEDDDLDERLS